MMCRSYKRLFNFLGSWFPDRDFEELTDEDIIKEYKKIIGPIEQNSEISTKGFYETER